MARPALGVREQIRALPAIELDWRSVAERAINAIEHAVPSDGWCVASADPSTLLMTGLTGTDVATEPRRFFELEYLHPDVLLQKDLASSKPHVGSLVSATEGHPERSVRWRDLLEPFGYHDQLRAALVSPTGCWGFFSLLRKASRRPYSPAEVAAVSAIVRTFADALRMALFAERTREATGFGSALVVLADDLSVEDASEGADRVFGSHVITGAEAPSEILALAVRARNGVTDHASSGDRSRINAMIHNDAGWFRAEAIPLAGSDQWRVAILVEQLRPPEATDLTLRARGLTGRETEITSQVMAGLSTDEIARALHLSPLTVQQHLKSIFAKFDVGSRRELMATLFFRRST